MSKESFVTNNIKKRQKKIIGNKEINPGGFIGWSIFGIIIVLITVYINSTIIFMIKHTKNIIKGNKRVLDIFFPSDCMEYPYYIPGNNHCKQSKTKYSKQSKTTSSSSPSDTYRFEGNKIFQELLKKSREDSMIYNKYTNSLFLGIKDKIINWYLKSTVSTHTTLNDYIKSIIDLAPDINNTLLMLFVCPIIIGLVTIVSMIYTFVGHLANLFLTDAPISSIALIITSFCSLGLLPFGVISVYAILVTIYTILKIIASPFIYGGNNKVIDIFKESANIIAIMSGAVMIMASAQYLNNNYTNSMIVFYILLLLVYGGYYIKQYAYN